MGMQKVSPIDTFGVPEFFTTHVTLEDAGSGLVRAIRSIERGGILLPVFCYVTPATAMVKNGPLHREFAEELLRWGLRAIGGH